MSEPRNRFQKSTLESMSVPYMCPVRTMSVPMSVFVPCLWSVWAYVRAVSVPDSCPSLCPSLCLCLCPSLTLDIDFQNLLWISGYFISWNILKVIFRAWRRPPDPAGVEAQNPEAYRQPGWEHAYLRKFLNVLGIQPACLLYKNCRQTLGESLHMTSKIFHDMKYLEFR